MDPFRFVHAARLLLDHQLRGTGPLPDSIRRIAEDATLLAWERVVETCLAERVDLLLLTGDCVEPSDQSVRGPAALLRGVERLAESEIIVVMAESANDPMVAWPSGLRWPRNFIRLGRLDEAPVARIGKLLAVVHREPGCTASAAGFVSRTERPPPECALPFDIWLSEGNRELPAAGSGGYGSVPAENCVPASRIDYHAVGGGTDARTAAFGRHVVHDPGPSQAISPLETGPRGCSLVEVDELGGWRRTFVPTAPVRFEQFHLTDGPEATRDDLLFQMIAALEQLPRHRSDQVFLVAWNISARGSFLDMAGADRSRDALLGALHANHGIPDVQVHTHAVRTQTDAGPVDDVDTEDELIRDFERHLSERAAEPQAALRRCLAESRLANGPWESPLRSLVAELDAIGIVRDARHLGRQWLTAEQELSP